MSDPTFYDDPVTPADTDTGNYQLAGRSDGGVVILMPRARMTNDEALLHAAWLVALATIDGGDPVARFLPVLEAVRNT